MTTEEKAIAIIKKMLELANKDQPVTISEDWKNPFAATVTIGDSHTHVGWEESTFEQFVDGLYNSLHGGPGLSFAKEETISLKTELETLRKDNIRLLEEIKQPRCHSCHSILGDNWCADCAGKADKERFEHYKRTGQDLFAKVSCNICGDPNCSEPNQKH
jgi:RNase P subunit RPR2